MFQFGDKKQIVQALEPARFVFSDTSFRIL